ncbi:MAG: hypothetical protein PSX36_11175 [bacterium]|nr:hypothetical protein [bacterium]
MKAKNTLLLSLITTAIVCLSFSTLIGKGADPKNKQNVIDQKRGDEKVLICHIPPGNPSNRQDIWVSPSAVSAHLAHGDFLGSCEKPVDPCKECYDNYQNCLANTNGDPVMIKICSAQYNQCRTNAGCGAAEAPGGK